MTESYTTLGICRVLRYEGGEGGQNSQNPRYVLCGRSLRGAYHGLSERRF